METYGKILLIAMPAFLVLVLFEKWWGWRRGETDFRNMDMISSLSSGITNVTKDVLGLSIAIVSYSWMQEKLAIVHISSSFWLYAIAFLALDFSGYWVHRIAHEYNLFWNNHIIHHSSEEFNLACALRQSISVFFRIFTFFLLPAALLGVPETVIAVTAPLHLFAQFWYHTRYIGKMGIWEKIIVTPSHHRVHHAINPEYLDKNYSQIFIFWDKLFGTFQEERPDLPPVYGITRPVRTWNPIKINFQHVWLLIKDALRTARWEDKLKIWFMPTGWRPADVAEEHPVYKISDPYHFEKYDTKASPFLHVWSWIQILITLLLLSFLFGNIAAINAADKSHIYLYGLFVFLQVYAYTELMDRNTRAWYWEMAKSLLGIGLIYVQGDWFQISTLLHPGFRWAILIYLISSPLITYFLTRQINDEESAATRFSPLVSGK